MDKEMIFKWINASQIKNERHNELFRLIKNY